MGQIVKFVELMHYCILSIKQQRNEMNRRYCDYESLPIGKIAAHSACDMFHGVST